MSDRRLKCDRVDVGNIENVVLQDLPRLTSRRPLALDFPKCSQIVTCISLPISWTISGWHPGNFPSRCHSSHVLWEIKSSTTRDQNESQARTRTIKPLSYRSRSGIPSRSLEESTSTNLGHCCVLKAVDIKLTLFRWWTPLDTAIHGILAATRPLSGLCHQGCRQAEVTGLLRLEFWGLKSWAEQSMVKQS